MRTINLLSPRAAAAAAALLAVLALAPSPACAAKASAADRVEARIAELRSQIKITPAQTGQWDKVTQVMRDNAKTQDGLAEARLQQSTRLTAVDDMKSYGEIVAAHAQGIKTLTPVFEALYDSMSDAQKKEADAAFRHGRRHRHDGHGKH